MPKEDPGVKAGALDPTTICPTSKEEKETNNLYQGGHFLKL